MRVVVGLPAASLAVMLGIVFIVNASRYGPLGVVGGVALTVSGLLLGRRCFRSAERPDP